MSEGRGTKGFKVVDADGQPIVGARGQPFVAGSTHTLPEGSPVVLCRSGFHFSRTPLECLLSLPALSPDATSCRYRLVAVEALGPVIEGLHKLATSSLHVTDDALDWATHMTGRVAIDGGHRKYRHGLLHQDDDDPEPAVSLVMPIHGVRYDSWYQRGVHGRAHGLPTVVQTHADGRVHYEWQAASGRLHRADDEPAAITFDSDGSAVRASWVVDGQPRRSAPSQPVNIFLTTQKTLVASWGLGRCRAWQLATADGVETLTLLDGDLHDADADDGARYLSLLRRLRVPVAPLVGPQPVHRKGKKRGDLDREAGFFST
jgi:hypothetical protein